jgi:hypothetical protein
MDASSQASGRSLEPVVDIESVVARRDSGRTLTVTAVYHLSEEGRKASLLDGGDGRAVQEIKVAVPTNRFHLVSVDADWCRAAETAAAILPGRGPERATQ